MIHSIYLAVVVDYDIYLEITECEPDQTWKDGSIFDFWTFCYLLPIQMIKYNPTHQKYESYANMIPATHKNQ